MTDTPEGYSRKTWPRPHPCISPQNRVGQAWKPGKAEVEGEDVFGNRKKFVIEKGLFKCRKCDMVVRIDIRGYAHCERCGLVYNDSVNIIETTSSNREQKRKSEKLKYDSRHYIP